MHNLYDITRKLESVSELLATIALVIVALTVMLLAITSAEHERRIKALEQAQQPKLAFHACPWSCDAAYRAQFRSNPTFLA